MNVALQPLSRVVAGQLLYRGARSIDTAHGELTAHVGQNLASGALAFALARGDLASPEPLLARVHSSCVTSETFGGCDCDCAEQLDAGLERIARAGRGVVFYLMQEGRGAGFAAKARDRMIVQASRNRVTTFEAYAQMGLARDHRRYEEVGFLCRLLGVRAPLVALTNNPEKLATLRSAAGVEIGEAVALAPSPTAYNHHYIAAKSRSGHHLDDPGGAMEGEDPPEAVSWFEPHALARQPRFVHMAAYLIPIRPFSSSGDRSPAAPEPASATEPHWFRLHAYFDIVSGVERVVLTYGPADAPQPLVRLQAESLFEHFRLRGGGRSRRLWHESLRRIVAHGAGCAAVIPPAGLTADLAEIPGDTAPAAALLAHHLRGRAARPIVAEEDGPRRAMLEALRRAGAVLLDPLRLPDA